MNLPHYSLDAFQTAAFGTVSKKSESAAEPSQRSISVPSSPVHFMSPTGLPSQTFWWLISPKQISSAAVPDEGINFSLLREKLYFWDLSWLWVAMPRMRFLARPHFASPLWPSSHLLWRRYSAGFRVLFARNYSIYSCRFGVSVEGDNFRIFLHHHVGLPLNTYPFKKAENHRNRYVCITFSVWESGLCQSSNNILLNKIFNGTCKIEWVKNKLSHNCIHSSFNQ